MADETAQETPPEPVQGPQITNMTQYVKDLSFESPNSPASLLDLKETPNGELSVQVKSRKLTGDQYEVVLQFQIEGTKGSETAFLVELQYAGLFTVSGFSSEDHQKALMIECPRLLFPYARRVIADTVRDGGFPQLMLGAIDFVQLYNTYLQKNQAEAESKPADA
ncbi:MAG: protein-export chaperone SecB [Alphaproteobacteria bacterium]|jgi:preprotein translocase subunit SecB